MATVTTGSVWSSLTGVTYKVTAVGRTGEETWIVYAKIGDPKSSYTCLEPAFIQRFRQHINQGY